MGAGVQDHPIHYLEPVVHKYDRSLFAISVQHALRFGTPSMYVFTPIGHVISKSEYSLIYCQL